MSDSRLPCSPAAWEELSALLDEGLDLEPAERAGWLARVASERPELAAALRAMLDGVASGPHPASEFLATPALEVIDGDAELRAGDRVGPYTLEAEIGSGGMGTVWRARRSDGAFEREVALKLPHPDLLSPGLRARFARERDILARLSHPRIARFLDAGMTADGRPYLALELVVGRPLTVAASGDRLGLTSRLVMFRQVLEAVAYAHARLVVHRDLKPSNVLVDAGGDVKLLDFGIAKLLAPETGDGGHTALTVGGARLATPDYAAPEQLAGGEVTVATDVWAAGVLLFELLTGRRPFRRGAVDEDEAPRALLASTRVDPQHAETVGGLGARRLAGALRGDLDAILARALAWAPADRYASIEALAADLDCHLRLAPIAARRIGRLARMGLFVRRHRLGVGLAALLGLAIGGGVAGTLFQAREAARAGRRAEITRQFLVDVFRASDPRIPRDRPRGEITARELLDLAAARLTSGLDAEPETRFELELLTATIYTYLDETSAARRHLAMARATGEQVLAAADERLLEALTLEVWLALDGGDRRSARALLSSLDGRLATAGLDRSVHRAAYHLAASDLAAAGGDVASRVRELERAVALYAAVAPRDSGHAAALSNLGLLALGRQDATSALALLDRALVAARDSDSVIGPDLARIESRRGRALLALARPDEAAVAFRAALAGFAGTVGGHHVTTWVARAGLARALAGTGASAEAGVALAELAALPGWGDPRRSRYRAEAELQAGLALAALGRRNEALPLLAAAATALGADPESGWELAQARAVVGGAPGR